MPNWKSAQRAGVITVRIDDMKAGDDVWVLLRSDAHHDSPYCDRKLEKYHLEIAKERNALILDNGDTFDAMQGKFDPRRSYGDIRPEDKVETYYNSIVDHAAEDYAPYADNWIMFGKGNHETAVANKANLCLLSMLTKELNQQDGANVHVGGYTGYVRFMFQYNKTKGKTFNLKYHHGSGGSAPVTRGVIQTNRQSVFLPDADIVWNGHNHQAYTLPIPRERLSRSGKISQDNLWHIRTPGYKNDWLRGEGWAVERNSGPTPMGAVWLKFFIRNDKIKMQVIPEIE